MLATATYRTYEKIPDFFSASNINCEEVLVVDGPQFAQQKSGIWYDTFS